MGEGWKRIVGYGCAVLLVAMAFWLLRDGAEDLPDVAPSAIGEEGVESPPEETAATLSAKGNTATVDAAPKPEYAEAKQVLRALTTKKGRALQAYLLFEMATHFPPDAEVIARLLEILKTDGGKNALSSGVMMRLAAMPVSILPQILPLMAAENARVRWFGIQILERWRQRGHAFESPSMLLLLDDPDQGVRYAALRLVSWGVPYEQALHDRLVTMIDEKGGLMARALVRMGDPAFDTFLALLRDADHDRQCELYAALEIASRERVARALPEIRLSLGVPDTQVNRAALHALVPLGAGAEPALPEVMILLGGESEVAAREALGVLGMIGPAARSAVPDVIRLLDSPNERLAEAATQTLGQIADGDTAAREALVQRIKEDASDEAAKALAAFGGQGLADALAIIRGVDPDAQFAALWTLATLGPEAASSVPVLIPLITQDKDVVLRERAVGTAGFIGPKAAAVIPAIMKALVSGEAPLLASSAAGTLPRLGAPAEDALRVGLGSKDEMLRLKCAIILKSFHGRSQFALEELAALLDDKDVSIRRTALEAISVSVFHPTIEGAEYPAWDDRALHTRLRVVFERAVKDADLQVRARGEQGLAGLKEFASRAGN